MSKKPTNSPTTESHGSVEPTDPGVTNGPPVTPAAPTANTLETPPIGPETGSETPQNGLVGDDQGDQDQDTDHAVNETLAAVTAERDALALQVAKLTVASEYGIPGDLLRGDDEDQLREHAEALKTYAGSRGPVDFGAGKRGELPRRDDTDPLRTALRR